jgi:hypothetical protein
VGLRAGDVGEEAGDVGGHGERKCSSA